MYQVLDTTDYEIVKAYETDSMAIEFRKQAENRPEIHITADGYIRFYSKIYVPTSEVQRIIKVGHAAVMHDHNGYRKTHDRIRNHYYFPEMKQRIRKFVGEYKKCLMNKLSNHKPYRTIKVHQILKRP